MIVGTQYLDNWGELVMTNQSTGDSATLTFHKPGMFSGNLPLHAVTGTVNDRHGNACFNLEGRWCDEIWAMPVQPYCDESMGIKVMGRQLLWRRASLPPWSPQMYGMSAFGYGLNEDVDLTSHEEAPRIPPTDARRRPDVRALEFADLDTAATEKVRVEELQRKARKDRNEAGAGAANDYGWTPRWFAVEGGRGGEGGDSPAAGGAGGLPRAGESGDGDGHGEHVAPEAWVFTQKYWDAKAAAAFGLEEEPSIF